MDLVEEGDPASLGKVADARAHLPLPRLAFDAPERFLVFHDDEIDLALVHVPEKTEFHVEPFRILDEMAVLEEMGGDQILETDGGGFALRPVPKVELLFLLDRPQPVPLKGGNPETVVEIFENPDPLIGRLVRDVQIFPQTLDGKGGTDTSGKDLCQEKNEINLFDLFEPDQIFIGDSSHTLPLPSSPMALAPLEEGFGKTPELQQKFQVFLGGILVELIDGEGMQSVKVVASLKGVSPLPVVIESC